MPWGPQRGAASSSADGGGELSRKLVWALGLLEDSLRVKNSDLCSVLIRKMGPIVYFTTLCIKEKKERGGDRTRDYRESGEVKRKTKRISF